MITVKIYRPAKTAMSTGRANTQYWVLEYLEEKTQYIEPVMQWTASTSTKPQVSLNFPTKEEAIQFALKNEWTYKIIEPKNRKIIPKSYTDNFIKQV